MEGRRGSAWVLGKYLLFQTPGWLVVGGLAWAAHRWLDLPALAGLAVLLLWMLKDAVLFPYLRVAYEEQQERTPVGSRAVATDTLAPQGFVRLGAELWRAEARGGEVIPAGAKVRVCAVEGLTLIVEPEDAG